jgi:hypothetical protein
MSTALGIDKLDATVAQRLYAILCNILNSLSCIPFLGMYYELENTIADSNKAVAKRTWLAWISAFIAIVALAEYALGTYLPAYSKEVAYWSSLVSGVLVGVCTGLFISKLTSRLFDLPLWTLLLLTVYVILQPVFAVITSNEYQNLSYLMVLIALYTKIVLLVVVEWKRDKHRILYFMTRAPETDDKKAHDEFSTIAEKAFGRRPDGGHFLKRWFFPILGAALFALLIQGIVSSTQTGGLESLKRASIYLELTEAFFLFAFAVYIVARGPRKTDTPEWTKLDANEKDQLRRATTAENQFFSYWTVLLFSWSILYVALGMRATALEHWSSLAGNAGYEVLVNLLNNITCIPFIAMYYELAEKTVEGSQTPIRKLWWPLALFFILGADLLQTFSDTSG